MERKLTETVAPSPRALPVARLVSVHAHVTIHLTGDSTVCLGRAPELPPAHQWDDPRLSNVHCEVTAATGGIFVVDKSSNGTFVNGARIGKDKKVPLRHGDTLSLLASVSPTDPPVEFVVQNLSREVVAPSSATDEDLATLTCSICTKIYHCAVSVIPCLHTFCGGCISQWAERSPQCAECRAVMRRLVRNFKIQSMTDSYVGKHPDAARSVEDRAALDAVCKVPPMGLDMKVAREAKRSRESSDDDDDDVEGEEEIDEEAEDDDAFGGHPPVGPPGTVFHPMGHLVAPSLMPSIRRCQECTVPHSDGFTCPDPPTHLRCILCKRTFPDRSKFTLPCAEVFRCMLCSAASCDRYFGGCPHPSAAGGYLSSLAAYAPTSLPVGEFFLRGNAVEQGVVATFVHSKGYSVKEVWARCVAKVLSGEWALEGHTVILTSATVVCKLCINRVFASLLYHYRREIPKAEMDPAMATRPDCWYGSNCRTQNNSTNATHALKFNHACPQSSKK